MSRAFNNTNAGKSAVVQAGPEFKLLATNALGDGSHPSAAVSGGRIFSYEEMALAADTLSQARAVARGIDLSSLGGSAAGAASPAGGPSLIDDQPYRHWASGGKPTAIDRAHERVTRIVAEHTPPPLDAAVDAELRRLARID